MPTLTIKKFPAKLHARLKRQAAAHRRSLNSEAVECIERGMARPVVNPEEILAQIRAHREKLTRIWVTEKDLNRAKRWGRL
jgi:plasmid stability protein